MSRETAESLGIWKDSGCRIAKNISLINADQSIEHCRVFQKIFVFRKRIFLRSTI